VCKNKHLRGADEGSGRGAGAGRDGRVWFCGRENDQLRRMRSVDLRQQLSRFLAPAAFQPDVPCPVCKNSTAGVEVKAFNQGGPCKNKNLKENGFIDL
jgi:hypothetical protein